MSRRWQCSVEEIKMASSIIILLSSLTSSLYEWRHSMLYAVTLSICAPLSLSLLPYLLHLPSLLHVAPEAPNCIKSESYSRSEWRWSMCSLGDLTLSVPMWTTVYLMWLVQTCNHGYRPELVQSSVVLGSHIPAWMMGSTIHYDHGERSLFNTGLKTML